MTRFKPMHLNQSAWKVAPYSHTMKALTVRECLLNHKVLKHTVNLRAVDWSTTLGCQINEYTRLFGTKET